MNKYYTQCIRIQILSILLPVKMNEIEGTRPNPCSQAFAPWFKLAAGVSIRFAPSVSKHIVLLHVRSVFFFFGDVQLLLVRATASAAACACCCVIHVCDASVCVMASKMPNPFVYQHSLFNLSRGGSDENSTRGADTILECKN